MVVLVFKDIVKVYSGGNKSLGNYQRPGFSPWDKKTLCFFDEVA